MTIALAHGAGAPMDSAFLDYFARGLGERLWRVVRFEFPYMAARRGTDRKPPPDREPKLRDAWLRVIDMLVPKRPGSERLIIGGKSMGGRIASLVASETNVAGLVCLGYPFHAQGRHPAPNVGTQTGSPTNPRVDHLRSISVPTLIVQGERDPFGTRAEVESYDLSPSVSLHWLPDGDHSFKPRKSSGVTESQNWAQALQAITAFINSCQD